LIANPNKNGLLALEMIARKCERQAANKTRDANLVGLQKDARQYSLRQHVRYEALRLICELAIYRRKWGYLNVAGNLATSDKTVYQPKEEWILTQHDSLAEEANNCMYPLLNYYSSLNSSVFRKRTLTFAETGAQLKTKSDWVRKISMEIYAEALNLESMHAEPGAKSYTEELEYDDVKYALEHLQMYFNESGDFIFVYDIKELLRKVI